MSAPSSSVQFLELLDKSGLIDAQRLQAYLLDRQADGGAVPPVPRALANAMVRDGLLTRFQAEHLLLGRWRHFVLSGKYVVLGPLGSGGMGHVYLCQHRIMRHRVAVKVLPAARVRKPAALERFHREARAVALLRHPNIVGGYDMDRDGKVHFLVMEYIDGSTFHRIVKERGPMDPLRAAHYVRQAALGLQHAYEAGLVHRDVKPSNLLLDRAGVVKILDMGLARFFREESDDLSVPGLASPLGTAEYIAPEQALDSHAADIRADIYSLGATFYFLLAGHSPFHKGTALEKMLSHQTRQPRPIRELRPEAPPGLAAVIERMMAKEPAERYQTPAQAAEALAAWTKAPIPPPPQEEMPESPPPVAGAWQAETARRFSRGPLRRLPFAARPAPRRRKTATPRRGRPPVPFCTRPAEFGQTPGVDSDILLGRAGPRPADPLSANRERGRRHGSPRPFGHTPAKRNDTVVRGRRPCHNGEEVRLAQGRGRGRVRPAPRGRRVRRLLPGDCRKRTRHDGPAGRKAAPRRRRRSAAKAARAGLFLSGGRRP